MREGILVAVVALGLTGAVMAADRFMFAGLSRATTVQDLKSRFPTSSVVGHYVYVSDLDARDHIYGIGFPGTEPDGLLRLIFERPADRTPTGKPQYPACASVERAVRATYGTPTTVRDFMEEAARTREFVWEGASETLSLRCFRMGAGPYLTDAITIEPRRRP